MSARLFTAAVFVVNFVQFYNMPSYGAILYNPLHLFSPLVSFPLRFAYFFCLMRPQSVGRSYWLIKDPNLNCEVVRAMLSTNRTYLSEVINQEMNTTFYQLINTYRLKKSVAMMQNPQHQQMKLHHIAEICGFKSLGAFSTFFKQVYGKTPTEWRNVTTR